MAKVAGNLRTFAGPSVSQQAGPAAITAARADINEQVPRSGVGAIAAGAAKLADALIDWQEEKLKEDGAVIYAKKMAELREAAGQDIADVEEKLKVVDDNGVYNVLVQTDDQDPHNGKPLSQYLQNRYADRSKAILDSVQNPHARKHLEQSIPLYGAEVAGSGVRMEAAARRAARIEGLGQALEMNANQVRANPNLLWGETGVLAQTEAAIKGAKLGGLDTEKQIDAARATLGYAAMSGIVKQDWRRAKTMLTDPTNKEFAPLMGMLKPNQMEHLLSVVDQQERIEQAELRSQVSQQVGDHFASLQAFGSGLPGFRELYKAAYADQPHMIKAFETKERVTRQGYTATQRLKTASLSDIPQIIEGIQPRGPGLGAAEAVQVAAHVQNVAEQHVRALLTDPAGTVGMLFKDELDAIKDPSARLARSIELQTMKGITRPQIFSKGELQSTIMDLQGAKPENVVGKVKEIIARTGNVQVPFAGDHVAARDLAFEQLQVASNGLPPVYLAIVGAVEDGDDRTANDLAKVLSRRKEGLTSMLPDKEAGLKAIRGEINTTLADWVRGAGLAGPERAEAIQAVKTAVEELALSKTFDGLDPVQAAKQAADQLVLSKYSLMRDGLQVPKRLPGLQGEVNPQRVLSGLAMERQRLSTDFQAKQALAATLKGDPKWAPQELKDLVHETALGNGQWINNDSNTGARYHITLRDGSKIPLRNPDGSFYEVPFTKAIEIGAASVAPVPGNSFRDGPLAVEVRTHKALKHEQQELRRYDQGGRHGLLFMENDGTLRPGRVKVFEDGTRRILPKEDK